MSNSERLSGNPDALFGKAYSDFSARIAELDLHLWDYNAVAEENLENYSFEVLLEEATLVVLQFANKEGEKILEISRIKFNTDKEKWGISVCFGLVVEGGRKEEELYITEFSDSQVISYIRNRERETFIYDNQLNSERLLGVKPSLQAVTGLLDLIADAPDNLSLESAVIRLHPEGNFWRMNPNND